MSDDVTRILNAIEGGDQRATDELLPLIYEELHLLAAQKLSHEKPGQTLQATALVHEAYMRLVGDKSQGWDGRGHFFVAAAESMRRILVDNARRKKRLKRGGNLDRVSFDDVHISTEIKISVDDLLDLDEALDQLARQDEAKANLIKLRCFAGLTREQTAKALGISTSTADENWAYARAWLRMQLTKGQGLDQG